ncbi:MULTISPECIES: nucleotidyltransferase domain-containing protein [Aeromonas]|uniref:nucleotidyltransferase domain-containing protein n=1 Tax=Aeromonas TaxID=642 RepID=UPI002247F452|nr:MULTISPECIES: nucleotidyltransferase domain-containing protein [Aeromonas]MCX0436598.1 nucleotidyltransferase domain-containing protein [Aeromonas veronii]
MTTHIYAFGSICRGEYESNSDIDLLVCMSGSENESHFEPSKFSIYEHQRLLELWQQGNPFAWHLYLESKLIFSSDGTDFIQELGAPNPYSNAQSDCLKFKALFDEYSSLLINEGTSSVFYLSCVFLAIRNIATCYSLHQKKPIFSRSSPYLVTPKLDLDEDVYRILLKSRVLSTRGVGDIISQDEIEIVKNHIYVIESWVRKLTESVCYE